MMASTVPGRAASLSTPAADVVAAPDTKLAPPDHIEQDGSDILRIIANDSNLTLNDSVHAPKNFRKIGAKNPDLKSTTMPTRHAPIMLYNNSPAALDEKQESESPSKRSEQEKLITKYHDDVIANFVREKFPGSECKARIC